MSDYNGLVFPLYRDIIERAVEQDKDVFVKFSRRQIDEGEELYLYESGENGRRKIVAKATVTSSQHLKPSKVKANYSDRVFQTEEELDEYTRGRGNKEMLVLELDDPEYLDQPVEAPGNLTVAGLYLDDERYEKLRNHL
jgi:hypothetical protein